MSDSFIQMFHNSMRLNLFGILNISASLLTISVGLITLLKNPRSPLHRLFFLITFASFLWVFGFGMVSLVEGVDAAHIWHSLAFLGVPYIPFFMYTFSRYVLSERVSKPFLFISFIAAVFVGVPYVFFNDRVILFKEFGWGRYPRVPPDMGPQLIFLGLMAFFFPYLFRAIYNLFLAWRRETLPHKRTQLFYLLMAFAIASTGTIDFAVAYNVDMFAFGFISITLFIMIIFFMIIRYQFLEVNLFLKKITLFSLIYLFLAAFSIPVYYLVATPILRGSGLNQYLLFFGLSLIFAVVFSLGPIIYAYMVRSNYWLKEQMSTGLTHELKSPLSSIQGAVEILLSETKNASPSQEKSEKYLEIIQRNSSRLERFVTDLLSLATIQENKVSLDAEKINLYDLVSQVRSLMEPAAAKKGIHLELISATPHSFSFQGDGEKLSQVVTNLLSNAIKFSDRGTITVELLRTDVHIQCSVQDQGAGISPKKLDKIFDRFYQADINSKGSGIGLAIAKAWVEAHGGKIWAESDGAGKGTKISFTLPAGDHH